MNRFDESVRRALESEAASVEVRPDALPEIRRRIAARRARRYPRGGIMFAFGSAVAAAATVVAVFAGAGTSCAPRSDPTPNPPVAHPSESNTPSIGPTPSGPAPSTGRPVGIPEVNVDVPVYFLGQDRGTPRLYRETRRTLAANNTSNEVTRAAITLMLDGRALDPDYSSPWPAGVQVRDVRVSGDTVTVNLGGSTGGGPGGATARAAVQQLIWTATAASRTGMARLLVDGAPLSTLWGVPVGGDLRRGPAVDVLGLVWVISPQQGSQMGRTFEVHLAGIVFEATVQVRIKRGGTVVYQQFHTLDKGPPEQGEIKFSVTLAPGTYTIEGYAESAADGSEQHLDNHQFTVG